MVCGPVGGIGRASKLFSKILFGPRVSDPRPPGSLQLLLQGTLARAASFSLVNGVGEGSHLSSLLAIRAVPPQPLPPEALCDWPLPAAARDQSSRVRASNAGSLGQCCRALQVES